MNQLNGLVDFLMGAVGKLIPAFVFLSIFSTITTGSFGEMGGAVKCILLHHPLCTDGTSRGASAPGHRGEPAAGIPHDGGKFNLPAVGAGAGIRPAGNAGRGAAAERQTAENRAPVKGPCFLLRRGCQIFRCRVGRLKSWEFMFTQRSTCSSSSAQVTDTWSKNAISGKRHSIIRVFSPLQ